MLVALPLPASGESSAGRSAGTYSDVTYSYYHQIEERLAGEPYDTINRLREAGIFDGTDCGSNKFCPDDPVDRKTFAVWLVRVLDGGDGSAQAASTPQFTDVPKNDSQRKFIERLAELGITNGCSLEPAKYCPSGAISRGQMATFIKKALDLPDAEPIGFWDVEESNRHFGSINSLVESGIDDGCSEIRFVPFDFCPNQLVSRSDLAMLLSEVIDYLEASEIFDLTVSQTDNSMGLNVNLNQGTFDIDVRWNNPSISKSISHYILQWRPYWQDFNYKRYQVVDFKTGGGYLIDFSNLDPERNYEKTLDSSNATNGDIYAFRVVVVYANQSQKVTGAVKVPNKNHRLRDNIGNMVARRGKEQPWLVDTWRHLSAPDVPLGLGANKVGKDSVGGYSHGQLLQPFAVGLELSPGNEIRDEFNRNTHIAPHELGHVYTLTAGIAENKAAPAIGYLYLRLLVQEYSVACSTDELYADLAIVAFQDAYSEFNPRTKKLLYWNGCDFGLDPQAHQRVTEEVREITKSVFIDQKIPRWFYDTYQLGDGSIDLDKLWGDVSGLIGGSRSLLIYGLKDEFGVIARTRKFASSIGARWHQSKPLGLMRVVANHPNQRPLNQLRSQTRNLKLKKQGLKTQPRIAQVIYQSS